MNHYSKDEQETVVNYYRTDDAISVYTTDTTVINKLKKLLNKPNSDWTVLREDIENNKTIMLECSAPKSCLIFRAKRPQAPKLTAEQIQHNTERLKHYRK